jgi:hypothetical protein
MLKIMKIKILVIRFSTKLIIIKFKTVKHYLLKAIQKKKIKTLTSLKYLRKKSRQKKISI